MSANTISIPTAADVAREVVAQLSQMGLVVPGGALDIKQAAEHLRLSTKTVRALVEKNQIRCGKVMGGNLESATLRFSLVELERWLRGE